MKTLRIKSEGLTSYYLKQYFEYGDESGMSFEEEIIKIDYEDEKDLERKLSFILIILTDK